MYRITFWNRHSTNFEKNSFVRQHGTESFPVTIEANALSCMMLAVRNPAIQKATMTGPYGCLSWTKTQPHTCSESFPSHFDTADECDYYDDSSEDFHYDDSDSNDCRDF